METQEFIREYANADVKTLALLGKRFPKVDMPFAINQIQGRQLAKTKLPMWAAIDGIIYPPHLNMEQCSSEQTAVYKQKLVRRLINSVEVNGKTSLTDLTGGFGVDFSYMSQVVETACYVERNEQLCNIAEQNFKRLRLKNVMLKNKDSIEFLQTLEPQTILFLDPARRNVNGGKVVSIEDCEPNVLALRDELMSKSQFVIVKLSPMLDWHKAVEQLECVFEVHILSVGNECKELLLVLSADEMAKNNKSETKIRVFCVNDEQCFEYERNNEKEANSSLKQRIFDMNSPLPNYLYEPNASLMKAGDYAQITERYDVAAVSANSHLFISNHWERNFPGRQFKIIDYCSLNKKELKEKIAGITQANISVRNFPMRVEELRKRLKIKDGGEVYIFATTRQNKEYILIIAKKVM